MIGNHVYSQGYRGFESLPLRHFAASGKMQRRARRGERPPGNSFVSAANTAAASIQLDEAGTRRLMDNQLRQAVWTVNTANPKGGNFANCTLNSTSNLPVEPRSRCSGMTKCNV